VGGPLTSAKYVIYANIEIDGVVEEPDVIGALFGQTEGLLGEDLDLRELQKNGRIGRIRVKLEIRNGKSRGTIVVPSNLDRVETAIIAATIESVDKVGPCDAKIRVTRIEDLRVKKRKWIVERAKEILRRWELESMPETRKIVEEVMKAVRAPEVIKWGPEKLPAGPDIDKSDTIIIVEGRADVVNLVKHGHRNVIALEGVSIPKSIIELCKQKTAIAFVDGDRGGELILRSLLRVADVDYVARAPQGKEVEELTAKEIAKALRNKVPAKEYLEALEKGEMKEEVMAPVPEGIVKGIIEGIPEHVIGLIDELQGTLEGVFYDENWKVLKRVAVRDLVDAITNTDSVYAIIFDGVITQRVVDQAFKKGIKIIVAARIGEVPRIPEGIKLLTFDEVKSALSLLKESQ